MGEQHSAPGAPTLPELYMSVRVSSRAFKSIADKLDSDLQLAMIFLTVVESSLESIIPLGGLAGQLDIVERDYLDSSGATLTLGSLG